MIRLAPLTMLIGLALLVRGASGAETTAATEPVRIDAVVFYALEEDRRSLREHFAPGSETRWSGYLGGLIGPHRIALAEMGAGTTLTAVNASGALVALKPRFAFSIGPAGALAPDIAPSQIFRINEVVAWQRGSLTDSGFALAPTATFALSPILPEKGAPAPTARLASGEAFVQSESGREQVRTLSEADLVDMNSSGLAIACGARKIPLGIWRIVSDRADAEAGEVFAGFATRYDGSLGRALADWLSDLPPDPLNLERHPGISRWMEKHDPAAEATETSAP